MPTPIEAEFPLTCAHPYSRCTNEPRAGYRNCLLHRATEPVTRTVEDCEFPGDVEGQHDHGRCVERLATAGRPGSKCRIVGCWYDVRAAGTCEFHHAAQVSL